jgi:hypothetical protein
MRFDKTPKLQTSQFKSLNFQLQPIYPIYQFLLLKLIKRQNYHLILFLLQKFEKIE